MDILRIHSAFGGDAAPLIAAHEDPDLGARGSSQAESSRAPSRSRRLFSPASPSACRRKRSVCERPASASAALAAGVTWTRPMRAQLPGAESSSQPCGAP